MSEQLRWLDVARRPRWLAVLALMLAVAAAFAWLGQWQFERSFRVVGQDLTDTTVLQLSEVAEPGEGLPAGLVDRLVSAEVTLAPNDSYLIANRRQLQPDGGTLPGYWLVSRATALHGEESATLTIAVGYFEAREAALDALASWRDSLVVQAFVPTIGRFEPSEAPQDLPTAEPDRQAGRAAILQSLSLAQLMNLYQADATEAPPASYPGFIILQEAPEGMTTIEIGLQQSQLEINWLNIFYAVEWVVFAGFAIFLWWRLVADQRLRELGDL